MNRKARFWAGFLFVVLIYSLPIAALSTTGAFWHLAIAVTCFFLSVYMVYRVTIRNIKTKYPIVNPEGHPDAYSGVCPRPIYEDMKRYPWFFNKKKRDKVEKKKVKKKS